MCLIASVLDPRRPLGRCCSELVVRDAGSNARVMPVERDMVFAATRPAVPLVTPASS